VNNAEADNGTMRRVCRHRTPLGYGNWLGLPEVSVPAGYGADGMPALNLSIVGLPGEDARVLAWAHAFERQAPRFEAPPRRVA
jgi:aspartyl-tRNA(Asn)/glutamyl-tRNA(Gln) amidotransferase subunit A